MLVLIYDESVMELDSGPAPFLLGPLTPDQATRMREEWEQLMTGDRGPDPIVVSAPAELTRLDPSPAPRRVLFTRLRLRDGPADGFGADFRAQVTATRVEADGHRYDPEDVDDEGRQVFRWVPDDPT